MKVKILLYVCFLFLGVLNAQTVVTKDFIKFTLNDADKTASVTGNSITSSNPDTNLVIPSEIVVSNTTYQVTSIGASAFATNTNIVGKLIINASLVSIGATAFDGCTALADTLVLPSTLKTLGVSSFRGCTGLAGKLVIPAGVTVIPSTAFQNCSKIAKFIVPSGLTTFEANAFDGCAALKDTLNIISGMTIGNQAFRNTGIYFRVDNAHATLSGDNGVLYDKNKINLIQATSAITGTYTIPATVTTIGQYSFYKCTSLTSVVIPSSVTKIEQYAFNGCSYLTAIELPSSVTSVGKFVLDNCSRLASVKASNFRMFACKIPSSATSLTLFGTIDARDFRYMRDSTSVRNVDLAQAGIAAYTGTAGPLIASTVYKANAIPQGSFANKTAFRQIVFPATATEIGNNAFEGCIGITGTFTISAPIAVIGNSAFLNANGINSFVFPNTLTTLGDNTFEGCSSWSGTLTLPESLTTIGKFTFTTCANLTGQVKMPAGVKTAGTYIFQGCRGINAVQVADSLSTLPEGLLSGCINLTEVIIPLKIKSIGNNAFEYCNSLKKITLPAQLTSIGSNAFYQCEKLAEISMPATITTINANAFSGCSSLKSISLPAELTTIGAGVFYGCSGLSSVVLPAKVKNIGSSAFSSCTGLKSVNIPDQVTAITDGLFSGCISLDTLLIPATVTSIGVQSFNRCYSLDSLKMSSAMKTIGVSAFADCISLKTVAIPASVTTIGNYAFANCAARVFVDPANTTYSSENGILYNFAKSTLIQCPVTQAGAFNVPATVTTIGGYAFYNCSKLTNVYIPAATITIESAAFYNCTGLVGLYVQSSAPANLSNAENVFGNINIDQCVLHVPAGSKSSYQSANQWNGFRKVVEDATGIRDLNLMLSFRNQNGSLEISGLEGNEIIEVYNLKGHLLKTVQANETIMRIDLPEKGVLIMQIGQFSKKIVNL
jgi:hypothetical protein